MFLICQVAKSDFTSRLIENAIKTHNRYVSQHCGLSTTERLHHEIISWLFEKFRKLFRVNFDSTKLHF